MKYHLYAVLGFAVSMLLLFVGVVVYQTVDNSDPPIEFEEGYAHAWNDGHDLTISYHRSVNVLKSTSAEIHRQVTCHHAGSDEVYDLQPLSREYIKGTSLNIHRLISFPTTQSLGTRCVLKTHIKWWPMFSMSAKVRGMPDIDFFVQDQPEVVR